jgi:5-formyltetrahydrofolate cyclo-ligase
MPASINELRRIALDARRNLSEEERISASKVICRRVINSREFGASKSLGCFLPMHDEVDTREIIEHAWRANKRVFVPILRSKFQMRFCEITAESELERDSFGIWEPVRGFLIDPQMLDLIVTPTVAFDQENNRIGMGSGYYDRCFAFLRNRRHWLRPKLMGVAFRCQQVEKIVPNPWDIPLYRVVTEQ